MHKSGLVIDERYERHRAAANHPERPERIAVLRERFADSDRLGLVRVEPRRATEEEILRNHDRALVDAVRASAERDAFAFDPDTHTSRDTFDTALLSAGGVLALVEAIMDGRVDNGFAMVRPPGHHAETDRAMGFCFFNNVAVAARFLHDRFGLARVLIMDYDVHHGNGTQRSFYAARNVLYVSTHELGNYPGTGAVQEAGSGDGEGFTVNLPFPPGVGDAEYLDVFRTVVEPIARQYEPQFVIVSAGFDVHRLDPLGGMLVTEQGVAAMTRTLIEVAGAHAGGRCAVVLEGGYSLTALQQCAQAVIDELRGEGSRPEIATGQSRADALIAAARNTHAPYWEI